MKLKALGPGLLFAGAAIGVSHLVQSTRAGAEYGFGLLWALLLVHLFKYPFFQFGARYATATGESLLAGYRKLGKGVLGIYFILNLATMFTIQAAVTIVTAGLAANLFGFSNDMVIWSAIITGIGILILGIGKYKVLDHLMKFIVITLAITTIIAVSMALFNNTQPLNFKQILPQGTLEVSFLIAFLGWLPAPVDVSIWQSLWVVEKKKIMQSITPKQALFDFNVGYGSTVFLAICFVALGALVMHHAGESFNAGAVQFSQQLIDLYTQNLGSATYLIIAIAAFTTMFSTTLTTLDASPRAMTQTVELLSKKTSSKLYWLWMILLAGGTLIILQFYISEMKLLVKIATILSFLTAPFYAIMNYLLISGKHTPKEWRPALWLKILSWLGILFLIGFGLWYLLVSI